MDIQRKPRLTVELVPETCWFSNVRDRLSRQDWDRVRKRVSGEAGHRCEVCGGRGSRHPVECHEVWEYEDVTLVQRLVSMVALCPACHEVKHIGRAGIMGRTTEAVEHLAEVNGWRFDQAEDYRRSAMSQWQRRSCHDWTLDISVLAAYGIDTAVISQTGELSGKARAQRASSVIARVQQHEARAPRIAERRSYVGRRLSLQPDRPNS